MGRAKKHTKKANQKIAVTIKEGSPVKIDDEDGSSVTK